MDYSRERDYYGYEMFRSFILCSKKTGIPLELSFELVCMANRDIMELLNIFPLDVLKHLFRPFSMLLVLCDNELKSEN